MIGMIQLERGNLNEAIDAFMRGLQAPDRTKEQEAALSLRDRRRLRGRSG